MNEARKDDGGCAFAAMGVGPAGDVFHEPGMSLRDWFAGQALPPIINASSSNRHDPFAGKPGGMKIVEAMAIDAYGLADAMLAARENPHD